MVSSSSTEKQQAKNDVKAYDFWEAHRRQDMTELL